MADLSSPKPPYRSVVAALAESQERYRTLVEGVKRYAIFMLDPKGTILTWNRGIEELLGYAEDEVVGRSGAMVFSAADRKSGVFKQELKEAKQEGESMMEHANIRKDGSEVRVHDSTTALHDSDDRLIGFAKVARRVDMAEDDPEAEAAAVELAKALATIQVEVEHRRKLEAQLLTAVEEERERLGRDLHDDLSQRLGGIAMMTRTLAKERAGRSASDRAKINEIGNLLTEAIAVAHNLSRGLHPVTLTTQGLPAALAELAERVPKEVQFYWPSSARLEFAQSVALHVYRIAEEAVGNAIRHSEADKITITLRLLSGRRVALVITDNGKGFPEGRPKGMGLQNMRYRAGAVGGTLEITSTGGGTVVNCTVPLTRSVSNLVGK